MLGQWFASAKPSRLDVAPTTGRLRRDEDGATALEFALVLPALVLLIIGIMETGRVVWVQNALNYSVDQAARCASVDKITCGSATQIQAYAGTQSGAGFSASVFTVSVAGCGIVVSGSAPVSLHIPFATSSLTLSAQSCYPN